jgi:hypothetical protein
MNAIAAKAGVFAVKVAVGVAVNVAVMQIAPSVSDTVTRCINKVKELRNEGRIVPSTLDDCVVGMAMN